MEQECGHEITGGYVYTGNPAGSRSMTLTLVKLHEVGSESTWWRGFDEEDMEVEVTVEGLTLPVIDRLTDRPAPATDAMRALRGCMAMYLDATTKGSGLPHYGVSDLAVTRTQWRRGASDMLVHLAMLALGMDEERAAVWVGEELQEMHANRG